LSLYLLAILVGIIAGYLRRGRLHHLVELRLRYSWLILVSLVIQLLIFPLFSGAPLLPYGTVPLHLVSYAILVVWLGMNLRVLPIGVLLLGAACNLAAVAANGGYMPASAAALQRSGLVHAAEWLLEGHPVANVVLMTSSTRLNVLGDWLYAPGWIPFSTAFSIGDVLIVVGIVWLIVRGMVANGREAERAA